MYKKLVKLSLDEVVFLKDMEQNYYSCTWEIISVAQKYGSRGTCLRYHIICSIYYHQSL